MSTDSQLDSQLDAIRLASQAKTKNTNIAAMRDSSKSLDENSVTKSHSLARAYYKLTLSEKRVMEAVISKLNPLRSDNPSSIELSAIEYAELYGVSKKRCYDDIRAAADSLITKVITLRLPDSKINRSKLTLFSRIDYSDSLGFIECTFNPDLIPYLCQLSGSFSSYYLKNVADFKSIYSWRLYELLVSWSNSKSPLVGWIDKLPVDEFRLSLGVPDTYRWGMFEKNVLNVAIDEISQKLRIRIKLEKHKTSRKYTHLSFSFIEDDQLGLPL